MRQNKKAQSTLEYIIVLAVIIAAVIAFATTTFKSKYSHALGNVAENMVDVVGRIRY
ncbi:MAG: hypothetical protein Q8N14_01310 [Candidatus Omnitrophota bacterium]|nr:hypothetical protein [Candidatus Omnitrophota bacterium]